MSVSTRLYALAVLVLIAYFTSGVFAQWLQPTDVVFPEGNFQDLPRTLEDSEQLARWTSLEAEDREKSEEEFEATDARYTVDRTYHNGKNASLSIHMALFDNFDLAMTHNPNNCYKHNGWEKIREKYLVYENADGKSSKASLITWKRDDGTRVRVVYWYQLGEDVFFFQPGLGRVVWRNRKNPISPPLVKVLLHLPVGPDAAEDEAALLSFIRPLEEWINLKMDAATEAAVEGDGGAEPADADESEDATT